jgi:hypothetical protein
MELPKEDEDKELSKWDGKCKDPQIGRSGVSRAQEAREKT